MKSLCLAASLFVFLWPALGVGNPAGQDSSPAGRSADENEKPFRDPFASESQPAKAQPKIKDPVQPMNRAFFHFNDKLYFWVLKPVGKGYSKVVPCPARTCVARLFANVKYPIRLVNNLLQGKFKAAGIETGRFAVNSTVGVGGLFDPAKRWKIEAHPADFDQTLGFYGVGPGIYFDWPLLGPSAARGTAGLAADGVLSPWSYIGGVGVALGVPASGELNSASLHLGDYESFKKAALDPYVAMRSAYYESRAGAVDKSKAKGNSAQKVAAIPFARGDD
ncbi:MAG: VacJ family lipoprotein [Limisphaerales bacterium]